jgi:hypothetical protein
VDELPRLPPKSCFKHFNLQETHFLPETKPVIGHIVNVTAQININSTRVIKTPVCMSEDEWKLTGKALIIHGELEQRVEYIGDIKNCEVHGVPLRIPFSTRIILPAQFVSDASQIVAGYIEDISLELLDHRSIFESVSVLLTAEC